MNLMNISLPSRQRVHWLRAGFPACGVGRHGKKGSWQLDFADVTCRRCVKIAKAATQPKTDQG
jgi:hypothetical protein